MRRTRRDDGRGSALAGCAALALWLGAAGAAAQAPEERGGLEIAEWNAGRVTAAGLSLPTRVIHPARGGPYPVVGVIHGAGRDGGRHVELARTLASRGLVAVLPDMPCSVVGCDHDANAAALSALLEWAEAQGATAGSPLAGLVDGSRRGLIGHSWGGLSSHLAASRDASIMALVLLDPNDNSARQGRGAAAAVRAASAQLLAAVPGSCNGLWDEDAITPAVATPALELTVTRSGHCDPEEPGDSLCPLGCGRGDAATSATFRRYAVAWVACVLSGDAAMASWLGGPSMTADEAGRIEGVVRRGLDALPCRGAAPGEDAGAMDDDAGTMDDDAGAGREDAGATREDGGAPPGLDASAGGGDAAIARDAGAGGEAGGGCGCRVGERRRALPLLALALLALARRRQTLRG
ncbi:MAG: hypothetical protein KF729_29615 [Sandaracinaceae bacterium]|nr:hypothetical protein [Sandaracinaceae bacterium]